MLLAKSPLNLWGESGIIITISKTLSSYNGETVTVSNSNLYYGQFRPCRHENFEKRFRRGEFKNGGGG